jgi:hypothetical protein
LDHNDVIGYFLSKDKNSIEIGKEIRLGWHPFTNPTNVKILPTKKTTLSLSKISISAFSLKASVAAAA